MSRELTFILLAPGLSLIDAVYFVDRALVKTGYRNGATISRIDMSHIPGLSNHTEVEVPFTASQQGGIAGWMALEMDFYSNTLAMDVSAAQWDQETTNIYVDVKTSILSREPRSDYFGRYLSAIVDIARSIRALGGVGGFAYGLERIDTGMLFDAIANNPSNPGFPSEMGLVKASETNKSSIKAMVSGSFRVEAYDDYSLLLSNDFVQLLETW